MVPSARERHQSCLELAQEGERLCRENNFTKGIEFLLDAIKVGSEDVNTLSAIYSQLGNAYFSTAAYDKALEYHKHDLLLTRFTGDLVGELKASSNVGLTFKALGDYYYALLFTRNQLNLARKLDEGPERKRLESRALYNLATIHSSRSRAAQKNGELTTTPFGEESTTERVPNSPLLNEDRRSDAGGEAQQQQQIQAVKDDSGDQSSVADSTGATASAAAAAVGMAGEVHKEPTYAEDLETAIKLYRESLVLSEEIRDVCSCGRTYGCLGNAYYMQGEYATAIEFHYKRLEVARQFGDRSAMRRAYTSLANSYVFLPNMGKAIDYYRLAVQVSREMNSDFALAQSCFSLGNAASLIADHQMALEFHTKHMQLARRLGDRAGEARAYSSVAQDLHALGYYPKAMYFLALRRRMAREMHDDDVVTSTNEQMRSLLHEAGEAMVDDEGEVRIDSTILPEADEPPVRLSTSLRSLYDVGDCGLSRSGLLSMSDSDLVAKDMKETDPDAFFDFLLKVQCKRLDEQRADPSILSDVTNRRQRQTDTLMMSPGDGPDAFLDYVMAAQGRRMDEQRAMLPFISDSQLLEKLKSEPRSSNDEEAREIDEHLYEMVLASQKGRIEEQRMELGGRRASDNGAQAETPVRRPMTIPEDDITDLVDRMQKGRMDEQRAALKPSEPETAQ